jgi:hypothetical protein
MLGGSIKRNIVNPDLISERAKCNFDKKEFAEFVLSKEVLNEMNVIIEEVRKDKNLQTDFKFMEMSREEQ